VPRASLLVAPLSLETKVGTYTRSQKKNRFGECYTCFGSETKTVVVRIQDRHIFSRIIQKVSIDGAEHRSPLKNYHALPPF